MSLPLAAPRPGLPSDAGSAPLSPSSRGQSRSSTSSPPPPPVRARASPPRVRRWARPLPPLLAGGRPPSGLPPPPVGVVSLPPVHGPPTPPEWVGGGFPVSPTLRLACPCAWGWARCGPRPPVSPGRIRRRGRARYGPRRGPRVGSVSPSRRLGTGVSPGSDGWPSRFCPRRPPPVRPAPLSRSEGVLSFPRVDRRRSLLSPPPSALVLPLDPRPVRPARPGSSPMPRWGGKEGRDGEGGKGGAVVVWWCRGGERRRSWDRRGGRGALSCDGGASARARTGAGPLGRGGSRPLSPPVRAARSSPLALASRPRLARSVPRAPPLARAPYPLSRSLALSLSLASPPRLGFARAPYLVDPASSICLSQRLSHACLSTHGRYSETANGSLNQLWFLWSLAPLLLG